VAIRKDVGADCYLLTDSAFDGKSASIDFRPDTLDDDATTNALITSAGHLSRSFFGAIPECRVSSSRFDAIHQCVT
jgi:hypothetical protein